MLEAYVELDRSREELARTASTPTSSSARVAMIDRAEYKRRQAPPGVKLRPKAFGRDRRTPITNRWQRLSAASTARRPSRAGRVERATSSSDRSSSSSVHQR